MKDAPALHRVEHFAFLALLGLMRALPLSAARPLGAFLGDLAWAAAPARRRIAIRNLRAALPGLPSPRVARRSFRSLGSHLLDLLASRRLDPGALCGRWSLEGWDHLREAEERGLGVFLMTAHWGCWEIAGQAIGLYRGPLDVVARPLDNPHLERHSVRLRGRFGNRVIPKQGAARGIRRALREGGRVGILIDQRVQPEFAIHVPFLGRPALTSPLLARMALRTGAPIVPFFGTLEPRGRYRIALEEPLYPTPEGEDPVHALTRRCLEIVEARIRAHPHLWLWAHDRWSEG